MPEDRRRGITLTTEENDRFGAVAVLIVAHGYRAPMIERCCDVSNPAARNLFWRAMFFLQKEVPA